MKMTYYTSKNSKYNVLKQRHKESDVQIQREDEQTQRELRSELKEHEQTQGTREHENEAKRHKDIT